VLDDAIAKESAKLESGVGIDRKGVAFRAGCYTYETIGGKSRDQVAVDFIMGHARDDMASAYRERITDERLRAIAEHVRAWLLAKPALEAQTPAAEEPPILKIVSA
jgi:hypothetical protein